MSDSLPPQTVTPPGTAAPEAQAIQGVPGGVPVPISGSFSATTTAHATAAAPAYTEGTDNPISCDLSGNIRTLASLSGASSFSDGSVDRQARVQDADTGAGTHWTAEVVLVKPASGGPVSFGSSTDPVRVDPTGSTTQPISASSLPLPTGAAQEHATAGSPHSVRLTDGAAFYKATTPADTQPISASALPLPSGASQEHAYDVDTDVGTENVQGVSWRKPAPGGSVAFGTSTDPVRVDPTGTTTQPVSGTVSVSNFPATQPVSGTVTANQGTAAALSGAWPVKPTDGTTAITVKAASTLPAATDTAEVVTLRDTATVSGTVTANQGTANATPWNENVAQFGGSAVATGTGASGAGVPRVTVANDSSILGTKTNNAAAPGATNFGVLPFLANAAVPSWTEGNQAAGSVDLNGAQRMAGRPPVVTGAYRIHVTTAQYAGLTAGQFIVSFRFTAAALCVVTRVRCFVTTQTAATAAGRIDRALFIVRSFTVADSGGTAITLTSPVGKLRTSHAATGVGNIMVSSGGALTAGTGTQDANPVGVIATAGTATQGIGLTLPPPGEDEDLFQYNAGQNYPIVLAQNEGLRITIPTAMPATIAMITAATFEWYEVATGNF